VISWIGILLGGSASPLDQYNLLAEKHSTGIPLKGLVTETVRDGSGSSRNCLLQLLTHVTMTQQTLYIPQMQRYYVFKTVLAIFTNWFLP
jgi:hypothetical protein